MKVRLLVDGERPKVGEEELRRVVEGAGIAVSHAGATMAIVVGGDGVFGRFGMTETLPLLFVGVRSRSATGSKAYLAATTFDRLPSALRAIAEGRYSVKEQKRLKVMREGRVLGEVFTDVYLQRGADSNCVRYEVSVRGPGISIDESAIGDGVVVTTAAGSTGYYSYPDRLHGDALRASGHTGIGEDELGICHIVPTYTERHGSGEHPLRYVVPWGSEVQLEITRHADARLYGVTTARGGIPLDIGQKVRISPSATATKVVVLGA